jgi:ubiquinol-cytochrome c reductase cytochrome c subunit
MTGRRSIVPWLLALVGAAALAQAFVSPTSHAALAAERSQLTQGGTLFGQSCASCHGEQGVGTSSGPPLTDVGPAAVDFMLSTGRMPLADPSFQPQHQEPQFSPEQIRAIVAYVQTFSTGGTPIPIVDTAAGSLSLGQQAFAGNCAACHGSAGSGDSIGGDEIAPALDRATPLQIAEAIRVGPGAMPRFGNTAVDQRALNSIARYVLYLRTVPNHGGIAFNRVGPVTEGFVGVVLGLGLLLVVIRLIGTRE